MRANSNTGADKTNPFPYNFKGYSLNIKMALLLVMNVDVPKLGEREFHGFHAS